VPADVAADLVHNAEARDWDDSTFDIFKWALVGGAKEGFNMRDYATYLFGNMIAGGKRPGALTAEGHAYFQKIARTHEKPALPKYEGVFSPKPPAPKAESPAVEAPAVESPKAEEPAAPEKPKTPAIARPKAQAHKVAPSATLPPSIAALWPGLDRSAMSYLGTPYVWGGTTHSGIDCSALTQNSYGENEVKIPRVSKDQWKTGTPIEQPALRQGDLIFFDTLGNGVSHVGMIVDPAKGPQFVHASSSHGVMLQDLSKKYYQARYLGARRVVP
jgi:cell wall-associated NlpC family hydrolase